LIEGSLKQERLGQLGAAMEQAQAALEEARASGNAEDIAGALVRIAMVHFRQGHYTEASALARQALELVPLPTSGRARAWLVLGMCAAETEALLDAEAYYHRALDLAREVGDVQIRFSALHNLAAGLYLPRGQFGLALSADLEALQVAREHDLRSHLPFPLITIAWAYWLSGQRACLQSALVELEQASSEYLCGQGYHAILAAELALEEGEPEKAAELLAHARSLAETCGDPSLSVDVRIALSRYQRLCGNAPGALDWADDAVACAARLGYSHRNGMALIERGRVRLEMADWTGAEADLKSAIQVLTPLHARFDLARAHLLLAASLDARQRPEAGSAWLEASGRILSGGFAFLVEAERAAALPLVARYASSADPALRSAAAALVDHLEHIPPPPLLIAVLGSFEVRRAGRPIPKAAWQRRADELFRLLLISPGRSLSREQVIEALWPDKAPEAANAVLHQATSCLRRALEPYLPDKFPSRYLPVEEGRIALRLPDGSRLDFEVFEELAQKGEWEAALAVYAGEPFPLDRYQGWASWKREGLIQRYMHVLLAAARARFASGKFEACLEACRQVLAEDPWQEQAALLAMQACVELDDRCGAVRIYRELERTLWEELEIAPQAELRALYESLR
jgi:DNA-binding SARP family transcriptional activator